MHLVCLGVVRKLLFLWLSGPLSTRLSSTTVSSISSALLSMSNYIPRDFSRKPRSLSEVKMWKATEYRQFLLYTGPVVLFGKLKHKVYRHFLLLSVCMRVLLSSAHLVLGYDYIEKLLIIFVKNMEIVYGMQVMTYTVHNLLHIVQDAQKFGSLDNVSCFAFENFLGQLKKMVRKPQNPVGQIKNCFTDCGSTSNFGLKKQHVDGPIWSGFAISQQQYKQYCSENVFLSVETGVNCIIIHQKLCIIQDIVVSDTSIYIVYKFFEIVDDFFQYPFQSNLLNIHKVDNLSDELKVVELRDVQGKCLLLPFSDHFVAMPLLHHNN